MDRNHAYPRQIPTARHELEVQQYTQDGFDALLQLVLDRNVQKQGIIAIDGFNVVPTQPGSLQVDVQPGIIVVNAPREPTTFGLLPADNTSVVKFARSLSNVRLSTPKPTTSGHSIIYVPYVSFVEEDINPTVVRYFNSANPDQPLLGPNNNGTSQFTKRTQRAVIGIAAGTSAPTGTQTEPAVPTGAVALMTVTVNSATTAVAAPNIVNKDHVHGLRNTRKLNTYQTEGLKKLTSDVTYYVNPTSGDDVNNDGLDATRPKRNVQALIDYIISSVNVNGYIVTIQLASATYTFPGGQGLYVSGKPAGAKWQWLKIQGNMSNPANVLISSTDGWAALGLVNCGHVRVQGVKVQASDTSTDAFNDGGHGIAIQDGTVVLDMVDFGACKQFQMICHDNGRIATNTDSATPSPGRLFISGSAKGFVCATDGGIAAIQGNFNSTTEAVVSNVSLTIRVVVSYSTAFLTASNGSLSFRFVTITNPTFVTNTRMISASSFGRVITGGNALPNGSGTLPNEPSARNGSVSTNGGLWF